MKYIVLDDEPIASAYLAELIRENDDEADITIMSNPIEAVSIALSEKFDVCFLDIQMPSLNGVDFAKRVKEAHPKTNFIFVTGYSDFMGSAFRLDASDYIMKPATSEQVKHAIENLRYLPENKILSEASGEDKALDIKIICFGNFDILAFGKPIKFKFDKTKELLAFLVHRHGARCSNNEIMVALWEDEGHGSYFRMLKKDLIDTFSTLGCDDLIYVERGSMSLANLDYISCDYFEWLEGKSTNSYKGEYMSQYSWAEEMKQWLEKI